VVATTCPFHVDPAWAQSARIAAGGEVIWVSEQWFGSIRRYDEISAPWADRLSSRDLLIVALLRMRMRRWLDGRDCIIMLHMTYPSVGRGLYHETKVWFVLISTSHGSGESQERRSCLSPPSSHGHCRGETSHLHAIVVTKD
jgi:hypothetical protein